MNVTWAWVAGTLLSVVLLAGGTVIKNNETRVEAVERGVQALEDREAELRITAAITEARYQDIIRRLEKIETLLEKLTAGRTTYPTTGFGSDTRR